MGKSSTAKLVNILASSVLSKAAHQRVIHTFIQFANSDATSSACSAKKQRTMKKSQRIRIITLLGLTSLLATMITITRYTTNYDGFSNVRPLRQISLKEWPSSRSASADPSDHSVFHGLIRDKPKLSLKNSLESEPQRSDVFMTESSVSDSESPPQPSLSQSSHRNSVRSSTVKMLVNSVSRVSKSKATDNNSANISDSNSLVNSSSLALNSGKTLLFANSSQQLTNSQTSSKSEINSVQTNSVNNSNLSAVLQTSLNDNKSSAKSVNISSNNKLNTNTKAIKKLAANKPKPSFNADDLKTTESLKIDKPDMCDNDYASNRDVVVMVSSAVFNFDARQAIRQTWGKFAQERGAPVFFLVGDTVDSAVQERLVAEDGQYEDILQGNFIDDYYNLTLKTIAMVRVVSERCFKTKYVLKIDDDVVINMQQLIDFAETRTYNKSIIGKLATQWRPHRNRRNKWFIPRQAYKGRMFPAFATGPAYLISGDALKPLYNMSVKLTPIYLEDVYMTGIVAERASIKRLNHALMANKAIPMDVCMFHRIITSHRNKPADILRIWDRVYNHPPVKCAPKKAAPKKTTKKEPESSVRSNSS